MEEYRKYFDTLVSISRREARLSLPSPLVPRPSPALPFDPSHGTPHEPTRSAPLSTRGPGLPSNSPVPGLAGHHTTLPRTRPAPSTGGPGKSSPVIARIQPSLPVIARSPRATSQSSPSPSNPSIQRPSDIIPNPRWPDIAIAPDGTIVLCPGCSGSDASKDGDYFICRSCGSVWRKR